MANSHRQKAEGGEHSVLVHIFNRDETGLVCLPTQLERTQQLVMVNVMKGGWRAPPHSPARPNFTLMIECTPESSRCYSVYSVGEKVGERKAKRKEEGRRNRRRPGLRTMEVGRETERKLIGQDSKTREMREGRKRNIDFDNPEFEGG